MRSRIWGRPHLVRSVRRAVVPIALAVSAALAGCGGDSDEATTQATATSPVPATTTTVEQPSGPMVRICDRRLAAAVTAALQEQGSAGRVGGKPVPSGNVRLSVCEMVGKGAEVSVSIDAATDAVRRYQFRVVESAQFSGGDPENAPHTVKGIGDPDLGGAGANWLPRTHLLLSVRGDRVLIVDVSADDLDDDDALLAAAKAISLDVYDRLGR
jgi:hypothetical protein